MAAAVWLAAVSPARAATCSGDCDGNGTVSIDELVRAVSIALGEPLERCPAADRNGDGSVSIDELVAAVVAALTSCGSQPDPAALRASTAVAASPLVSVLDFGSVGAGGTGAGARAALVRPAQSGCVTNECVASGSVTGTQQVCCLGTEYSLTASGCSFDTPDGNVIEQNGTFILDSPTADVCLGVIPVGQSFTTRFDTFFSSVTAPSGAFEARMEAYSETFEVAQQPGCSTQQPDAFSLAMRGDGVRHLDGTRQVVVGDPSGVITTNFQAHFGGLSVATISRPRGAACDVAAELNGGIEVMDTLTGSDVVTTYDRLGVAQARDGADLLLVYRGTVGTNCLGAVTISTIAPVRLRRDDPCPVGGAVRLDLQAGSIAVTFTPTGGVELDFGADGSVDERLDRCEQLQLQQCTFQPPAGACAPCTGPQDCTGNLQCYPCSFSCQSSGQMRCSTSTDFITCNDGVY